MNKEYKVIPFSEVAIGQEFEDATSQYKSMSIDPWVKMEEDAYKAKKGFDEWSDGADEFSKGCLVRIADCEPVESTKTCPLPLPLTVRGEGSDSWLEDAEGRAVVAMTQGLDNDEHVKFLNWIAARAK